jgi:2-polyprenyl-3-methyl-5-hydroxy-6-metoxy-1,4-benzoquinol methylase
MWFDSPYYPLLYAHRSEAEARQAVQTLVRHLQLEPGARILDVGCGRGRHLWPLLEQGKLLPSIYKVFPLAQAGAAHALMESSEHIGKIMLEVRAA